MNFAGITRKALESMYSGVCNIIERQKVTDPVTKRTAFSEVTVLLSQPCRLSYKSAPITRDGEAASVTQEITLFISPDVEIKSGSKIEVTQRGRTTAFSNSGEPKVYDSHQEISLTKWEKWS